MTLDHYKIVRIVHRILRLYADENSVVPDNVARFLAKNSKRSKRPRDKKKNPTTTRASKKRRIA